MNEVSAFSERICEFLHLKNLTPKTLAQALNITHATILNFKNGKCFPSTKIFIQLADYFQCSCDYLLGLTDDYPDYYTYRPATAHFPSRFRGLLKNAGVSQYQLTKKYGVSGNLVYKWLNNNGYPSVANLIRLARILNQPVDYILGREE